MSEQQRLLKQLETHTRDMRRLQKRYFAERSPDVLELSKAAERLVDAVLEEIEALARPTLF